MYLSEIETSSRRNNLTLIRLLAATAVTFGHSFAMLTGTHYEIIPGLNSGSFGFLAVSVFFALSGLLISQSYARRRHWQGYFEARWLRIFPGLFFANFITAIIVSQIVKHQGWSALLDLKNWGYTFGSFFFDYSYFDGVFANNPIPATNGSLWTLSIEFRMYLFVLVIGSVGLLGRRYLALAVAVALALCVPLHFDFVVLDVFKVLFKTKSYDPTFIALPLCFGLGILSFLFKERVRLSIITSAVLLLGVFFIDHWLFKVLAFVYAALVFGFHPRLYIRHLDFKFDLSYGIYVLSWPVQQAIILSGGANSNPLILFGATMLVVTPLAFMSWYLVEKPAMELKGKFSSYLLRKKLAH